MAHNSGVMWKSQLFAAAAIIMLKLLGAIVQSLVARMTRRTGYVRPDQCSIQIWTKILCRVMWEFCGLYTAFWAKICISFLHFYLTILTHLQFVIWKYDILIASDIIISNWLIRRTRSYVWHIQVNKNLRTTRRNNTFWYILIYLWSNY